MTDTPRCPNCGSDDRDPVIGYGCGGSTGDMGEIRCPDPWHSATSTSQDTSDTTTTRIPCGVQDHADTTQIVGGSSVATLCQCGHDKPTHRVQIGRKQNQVLHGCYICQECTHFQPAEATSTSGSTVAETVSCVSEVHPIEPPSCSYCGTMMTPTGYKCLSCELSTGAEPAPQTATEKVIADWDAMITHAAETLPFDEFMRRAEAVRKILKAGR